MLKAISFHAISGVGQGAQGGGPHGDGIRSAQHQEVGGEQAQKRKLSLSSSIKMPVHSSLFNKENVTPGIVERILGIEESLYQFTFERILCNVRVRLLHKINHNDPNVPHKSKFDKILHHYIS